jgi:hypothetical protein
MGRRETPIDPSEGPVHAFAHDLRVLRAKAGGLPYRSLAKQAGYGHSTLAEAASGKVWPTLDLVRAFVGACGGDQEEWAKRWRAVNAQLTAQRTRSNHKARPEERIKRAYAVALPADQRLVDLLAAVHRYWIGADLHPRLELTGRLPVRLADNTEPARSLPETASIHDIFRHSPQLLVLGEPGTGKTILLQELALKLIDGWADDPTQPVPIIVPLSSWAQHRPSLESWLVDELFRLYSVDRKLGWRWVRHRRIMPLLDGLDEVPAKHRGACVAAITDYRRNRGAVYPIVVTCRTAAYRSLDTPLRPRRTVVVQRLSMADVGHYLQAAGPDFAGVRDAIEHDADLAEMATTPLFLAMITYAYRGRTPPAHARHRLFSDYVAQRLNDEFPGKPELARRPVTYPQQRVLHWLSWLARTMKATNQTIFHPDLMQLDLLSSRLHRWLIRPGLAIMVGLVAATLFGALFWLAFNMISTAEAGRANAGVAAGIIAAAVSGLACGSQCLRWTIEPTRPPHRSAAQLRISVLRTAGWAAAGAAIGVMVGSWFGYMDADGALGPVSYTVVGILGRQLGGIPGGTTLGGFVGLALGIVNSLKTEPNVRPARPGIGMQETLRVAVSVGAATTVLGVITYGVLGVPAGALVALRIGGAAYLSHTMLRLLLAREDAIPRQILTFLHHQHTLTLLSEIGGGYKFAHPLLQDYFVKLETPP